LLLAGTFPAPSLAQEAIVCESTMVVQADDWLSHISEKVYDDVLAYRPIAEATNEEVLFNYHARTKAGLAIVMAILSLTLDALNW
jgi:nucleoid-associated protein YgaU